MDHAVKIKTEFQDSSQFVDIQDCELGSWSIFFFSSQWFPNMNAFIVQDHVIKGPYKTHSHGGDHNWIAIDSF